MYLTRGIIFIDNCFDLVLKEAEKKTLIMYMCMYMYEYLKSFKFCFQVLDLFERLTCWGVLCIFVDFFVSVVFFVSFYKYMY